MELIWQGFIMEMGAQTLPWQVAPYEDSNYKMKMAELKSNSALCEISNLPHLQSLIQEAGPEY